MNSHCLYIIRCENNYLYVGITSDIDRRIHQHRNGLCRNTKHRGRINIAYTEWFDARSKAAKREKEIKGWRREKKELLISAQDKSLL